MENIIYKLINEFTEGVDTYTHKDSTWLIFTESKQWVIELTKEKTLWYNYNFFKEVFEYTSMNVIKHQQYITKWVEDKIIDGVNRIKYTQSHQEPKFKEVLQNGVKKTNVCNYVNPDDGIMWIKWGYHIDDVIENGVNHTEIGWHQCNNVDDSIEKGVRETMFNQGHRQTAVKNIIENGILRTKTPGEDGDIVGYLEWVDDKTIRKFPEIINDIIDNGIKETKSWNESIIGDLNQYGCIDNVIKEGVKETNPIGDESSNYPTLVINHIIKNGVKVSGTFVGGKRQKENVDVVINCGVKETKGDASQNPMGKVTKVIKEGIKNPTY